MNKKDNEILCESSQLCLHCGLCCMGYFHNKAIINNDEDLSIAKQMGASIIEYSDNKQYFEHPCPKFDVKCTIYPDRPSACENYKCDLLKNVEEGKIEFEKAITIVDEMKMLCKTLDNGLDPLSSTGTLRKRFSMLLTSKSTAIKEKKHPTLMLNYATFMMLKDKYFIHTKNLYFKESFEE